MRELSRFVGGDLTGILPAVSRANLGEDKVVPVVLLLQPDSLEYKT